MHKNHLQEYSQKRGLPAPIYRNTNEGLPHAPMFRSTVLVDGKKYTSLQTFRHKKEAEQQAAQYALKGLVSRIKEESCTLIQQDTIFCKSILVEFATKVNLNHPTYSTLLSEEPRPGFVSSLVFDGETYTGEVAGNKKEAEQLAARATIQSLLGSDSGAVLREMIKAKRKLNAPLEREGSSSQQPTINISDSVGGYSSKGETISPSHVAKRKLEIKHPEEKKVRIYRYLFNNI
ncbi:hypothetical protein Vadar_034663 [Vaccinium darrowii]|uniref:Uncharacterized protein n=1 Tax=Vaccinium darrowii TaxID=229202 RepID=A0ACB7YJ82_9ERIC|nr:hypothetical protein Vadar_034663 [Vaccinium darrowii]